MRQQTPPSQPPRAGAAAPDAPRARRNAKSFALRLVPTACAALALALTLAPLALSQPEVENSNKATAPAEKQPAPDATKQDAPDAKAGETEASKAGVDSQPGAAGGPGAAQSPAAQSTRVRRAYRIDAKRKSDGTFADPDDARKAGLNDIVVVEVENLDDLLFRSECRRPAQNPQPGASLYEEVGGDCRKQNILLYIEGRALKGLQPESGAPELEASGYGTLRYHLQRPEEGEGASDDDVRDTKEHWADLLGLSYTDIPNPWTRDVSISVGLEREFPVATLVDGDDDFKLVRVRRGRFLFWAALLVAFIYGFWRLATRGDIIRDRKPIVWNPKRPERKAYSLSRTQIAWWTFFIVFGFIFIWLVTGQHDLSMSALVLLGIGVITTTGAIVIDRSRAVNPSGGDDEGDSPKTGRLMELMREKEQRETGLNEAQKEIADAIKRSDAAKKQEWTDKLKTSLDDYNKLIETIRKEFPGALGWWHSRFDLDILSDAHGVSIHRFQMVLWTVVLGFVFIHEVFTRLSMPEFSGTLLTLLGISNGTYLLGKSSEPQTVQPSTPTGTPGTPTGDSQSQAGADQTASQAAADRTAAQTAAAQTAAAQAAAQAAAEQAAAEQAAAQAAAEQAAAEQAAADQAAADRAAAEQAAAARPGADTPGATPGGPDDDSTLPPPPEDGPGESGSGGLVG